jgi:hypothetical protein
VKVVVMSNLVNASCHAVKNRLPSCILYPYIKTETYCGNCNFIPTCRHKSYGSSVGVATG